MKIGDQLNIQRWAEDPASHAIVCLRSDGKIWRRTLAGAEQVVHEPPANIGSAIETDLLEPSAAAVGPDNTIYIAEYMRNRVLSIDPAGRVKILTDRAYGPKTLAVDSKGIVYIGERNGRLLRLAPDGVLGVHPAWLPGPPWILKVDAQDRLYALTGSDPEVVRINADGTVDYLGGSSLDYYYSQRGVDSYTPFAGMAIAPDGSIYVGIPASVFPPASGSQLLQLAPGAEDWRLITLGTAP